MDLKVSEAVVPEYACVLKRETRILMFALVHEEVIIQV